MTEGDADWPGVVGNLQKARKIWRKLSQILSREGADPKVSGNIFKAVTHAVLLFGAETWVITPRMERALSSFQHRVARRLTGRKLSIPGGGSWEYPSLEEEMVESGFEGIVTYITRSQNTVTQYIATQPILDLCERSDRSPGAKVSQRWWEQDGLDLEGAEKREVAAAESDREETIGEEEGMHLEMMKGRE